MRHGITHSDLIDQVRDSITQDVVELEEELHLTRIACVDRPMKMKELEMIFGISGHGIRKWDIGIKNGIQFSELYRLVKKHKPTKLNKLNVYIKREVNKRKAVLCI